MRRAIITSFEIVRGLAYAVALAADIINLAAYTMFSSMSSEDINYWVEQFDTATVRGTGGLFVTCAGNEGYDLGSSKFSTFYFPQQIRRDWHLVVAATQESDYLTNWSNYSLSYVQIAAPGQDIYSTVPGGYAFNSGTSFAAPIVSGVAALAYSTHPTISDAATLKDLLLSSSEGIARIPSYAVQGSRRVNAVNAVYW